MFCVVLYFPTVVITVGFLLKTLLVFENPKIFIYFAKLKHKTMEVSLQFDANNIAAKKLIDAILSTGLFTMLRSSSKDDELPTYSPTEIGKEEIKKIFAADRKRAAKRAEKYL